MARDSNIQRSFAGGELAPALHARADLAKYQTGLRSCKNFIVRRHGGVTLRGGTKFVAEGNTAGSEGGRIFLLPFVFPGAGESYVVEAGEMYFRFHKNGAPVEYSSAPGTPVQITTPYNVGAFTPIAPLCWTQNGRTVKLTSLSFTPRKLTWGGNGEDWTLEEIVFGSSLAAPGTLTGLAGVAGTQTRSYVITAVGASPTHEESLPSAVVAIEYAGEPTKDSPHVVGWAAVTGAECYYVYGDAGDGNGEYGFLGVSKTTEFRDTNFIPDYANTPPQQQESGNLFGTDPSDPASENKHPAVNCVHQQRQIFGGRHVNRSTVFCSQTGLEENFHVRSPIQDDDAITFTPVSQYAQVLMHLLSLQLGLVMLTDTGEWLVPGNAEGVLTPTAQNPKQHGFVGSSCIAPVVVGESVVFLQARNNCLRDLRFDERIQGLSGRDLSMYAAHLFEGRTIVRLAYAMVPDSVIWALRDDGVLLGLTYIRDEDVWGWHRHEFAGGIVKDICVIPENNEDALYLAVQRDTPDGVKYYIEKLHNNLVASDEFVREDAYHVDCGITYDGADTETVDGLDHLEGQQVMALANGEIQGPFTVEGGAITLDAAASKVHVGLPISAELETLALDAGVLSVRDRYKGVQAVHLLLENSALGFSVGPDENHLTELVAARWASDVDLRSGVEELNITKHFNEDGRVLVRHTLPTPLTINAIIPFLEMEAA